VQCPKDRGSLLVSNDLMGLLVKHCSVCEGNWIPPENYAEWQKHQPSVATPEVLIERVLNTEYVPSATDTKAALCPDCQCYLARAKVSMQPSFYLERCPNCKGIWCDRGEWEALQKTGLHVELERVFSADWQNQVREREQAVQERRATIDKLGFDLATRVFELAEALEHHPNGDFGVAYLMRRLNK
jgi:Zn-finger nucleic acid-binding protein